MKAVADHGEITGDTIKPNIPEAAQVFVDLAAVGIDMPDVFTVLETEGVQKFIVAWEELLGTIETALKSARGATPPHDHRGLRIRCATRGTGDCRASRVPAAWSSSA